MGFLSNIASKTNSRGVEALNYLRNPFPTGAQVVAEVFVERPELDALKREMEQFLQNPGHAGGFWALQGARGLGKTNFLRHVELELQRLKGANLTSGLAVRYLTAQEAHPRRVMGELFAALGEPRLQALVKAWSAGAHRLPETMRSTDFGRFFSHAARIGEKKEGNAEAVRFLVRWLGGQQTVKEERETFGVLVRDKLPPAVALPYLTAIIDMLAMREPGLGVVLMIDELEDFQTLGLPERQEYAHTLKTIVNAFNQKRLFLIAAGQAAAFNTLRGLYPSLGSRWKSADLQGLRDASEAVKLARAYMEHEHKQWVAAKEGRTRRGVEHLQPDRKTIEAAFARSFPNNDHRRLLTELHDEFEKIAGAR
ncbi:MAG: BREX system ATP-binding domain-containing protein [Polyangiales bacterium]